VAREQRLAEVFVELADTLVEQFDVVDFLQVLTERCVELVDTDAAGLMLDDQRGALQVVAYTDESARLLELFELQRGGAMPGLLRHRPGHLQRRSGRRREPVADLRRGGARGGVHVVPCAAAPAPASGDRRAQPVLGRITPPQ
jgi:hypothetical protein